VCLRLGQLVNQSELGRDIATPQATVHRWMNLLEVSYQLVRVPAYGLNRTKRLIKTPKLYWADTGLALHLAGLVEPTGAHLENLVLTDLLAWRDARLDRPEVFYWRTSNGEEVDFIIEAGDTLLPIEVKAASKPRTADAKHIRVFREEYGRRCRPGLVLHTGESIEWLAPGILACPWWRVV
jgi:predicted AAA+ superfamily ATPase